MRSSPSLSRCGVPSVAVMLADLEARHGLLTADILGVPTGTLEQWRYGGRTPSAAAVRVMWLAWVLVLHPEQCQTAFDLIAWGRFAVAPRRRRSGKPVQVPAKPA